MTSINENISNSLLSNLSHNLSNNNRNQLSAAINHKRNNNSSSTTNSTVININTNYMNKKCSIIHVGSNDLLLTRPRSTALISSDRSESEAERRNLLIQNMIDRSSLNNSMNNRKNSSNNPSTTATSIATMQQSTHYSKPSSKPQEGRKHPSNNHNLYANLTEAQLIEEWKDILVNEIGRDSDRIYELLLVSSIPRAVRSSVWLYMSGAEELKNSYDSSYYTELLALYNTHGSSFDDEIDKDVKRTLPSLNKYKSNSVASDELRRLLGLFCLRNYQTGYTQGMNSLGGLILTLFSSEEEAFWFLCVLIESRLSYYNRSLCGLAVDCRVLNSLISYHLPHIAKQLARYEIAVESFSIAWFVCLFCESPIPLLDTYAFLDWLLLYGDQIFFSIALALLKNNQSHILKCRDNAELLDFLLHSGIRNNLNILEMLRAIKLGLLEREIQLLREFHSAEVLEIAKNLNYNTAKRMAKQYCLTSAESVITLWKQFLATEPWSILLHSAINTHLQFARALLPTAFTEQQRSQFIDCGLLLSGVMERLYDCIDVNNTSCLSFEQYVSTVAIFQSAANSAQRYELCFRYYDLDNNSFISREELLQGFKQFHYMYIGKALDIEEKEISLLVNMLFNKAVTIAQANNSSLVEQIDRVGLNLSLFSSIICQHPFTSNFFSLIASPNV
jgi:hypothetical protein